MPTPAYRPDVLTPELVLNHYEALLRSRIRSFRLPESMEEDLFQEMFLSLIQPSETLGTSYIQRYNPVRAAASVYLQMFANQWLIKYLDRQEREVAFDCSLTFAFTEQEEASGSEISEAVVADEGTWRVVLENDALREEILRLVDRAPYNQPASYAPDGEPRSTKRIVELLLVEELSMREIGRRLSLSPNEVCRRVKMLRRERWVRQMAADMGVSADR